MCFLDRKSCRNTKIPPFQQDLFCRKVFPDEKIEVEKLKMWVLQLSKLEFDVSILFLQLGP